MKNAAVKTFVAAASMVCQTAFAGGSIPLSEIMPLVQQSPKLAANVDAALSLTSSNVQDIVCVGVRLGRQFGPLGGARVAPYTCQFAPTLSLTVQAQTTVVIENHAPVDINDADTILSALEENPQTAIVTSETLTGWYWE